MLEVLCPACGGLFEADEEAELIALATDHSLRAHGHRLPAEHVRLSMSPVDDA